MRVLDCRRQSWRDKAKIHNGKNDCNFTPPIGLIFSGR
jgi:hypothetical protein